MHASGFRRGGARRNSARLNDRVLHARRRVDEHLLDARQCLQRLLAAGGRIDRHLAPAGNVEAGFGHRRVDRVAFTASARHRSWLQEHGAGGEAFRDGDAGTRAATRAGTPSGFEQQAAAVAGLAVRRHGAAVRQPVSAVIAVSTTQWLG